MTRLLQFFRWWLAKCPQCVALKRECDACKDNRQW